MTGTSPSPRADRSAGRLAAVLGVPALISALSLASPVLAGFTSVSCQSPPVGGESAPVGGESAPVGGESAPVACESAPVEGGPAPTTAPPASEPAAGTGPAAPVFVPPPASADGASSSPAPAASPSSPSSPSSPTAAPTVAPASAPPSPVSPGSAAEAAVVAALQSLPGTVPPAVRDEVERSVRGALPTIALRASSPAAAAAAVQNAVTGAATLLGLGLSGEARSGAVTAVAQGAAALASLPAAQQTDLRGPLVEAVRASAAAGHLSPPDGHVGAAAVLSRVVDALGATGRLAQVDGDLVGRVLTTATAVGATGRGAGAPGPVVPSVSLDARGVWTLELRGLRAGETALVVLSLPRATSSRAVLELGAGRRAASAPEVLSYTAVADGSGRALVRVPALTGLSDAAARRGYVQVVARGADGVRRVFTRPARPGVRPALVSPVPASFLPGVPVVIRGSAASGETVQLLGSEAGRPYRLLREVSAGSEGAFVFTTRPIVSTRFVVRVRRDAQEKADARSFAVLATPRLTATSAVSGRTALLAGTVRPARAGTPVLVVGTVPATQRSVVLGRAVTDGAGRWSLRRAFGAPAVVDATARVAADRAHSAGRSPAVRVRIR